MSQGVASAAVVEITAIDAAVAALTIATAAATVAMMSVTVTSVATRAAAAALAVAMVVVEVGAVVAAAVLAVTVAVNAAVVVCWQPLSWRSARKGDGRSRCRSRTRSCRIVASPAHTKGRREGQCFAPEELLLPLRG